MACKRWFLGLSLMVSCAAHAITVDFDLNQPFSADGQQGYFADAYYYQEEGVNLSVSAWSSGGDAFDSFGGLERAQLGVFSSYGVGVEGAGAMSHTIDNFGSDFDFLLLEFDRDVSLEGFGISHIEADTDVSLAAFDGSTLALGSVYDANMGYNGVNTAGFGASLWLIGAFHPLFGLAQDNFWDGFKIDSLAVNINPVPLPAAFWFFITGLIGFGWFRRKAVSVA